MKTNHLFYAQGIAMIALFFAIQLAAAKTSDLLEMSEQLDQLDKQDLMTAIDKANACTQARNFLCTESELAKAAKAANSGKDKKTLLAARQNMENEKQRVANEIKRAEEERQARLRREEEERQAQLRREEDRQAQAEREARRAREAEDQQSNSDFYASLGEQIRQRGAEDAALLNKMNNQTIAAYAETNRRLAAQAAERDRARAEQNEREADRRRDAERDRANAQRTAQAQDQSEANARSKRDADALRARQEHEQKRLDDERRNQEARDNSERKRVAEAAAAKQKADAAATKLAEQQAEKQAREQYLTRVATGTRLVATKCPDGEGKYYATGSRPNIKPEVVACVDVRFRAYCPGSTQYSEVVAHNFIGMSGCFGDTYDINPKPACKIDQVHIEVIDARTCGG